MISDQEIIDLVTARMQGKKILHKSKYVPSDDAWTCMPSNEEWSFDDTLYMVAPEPRTLYAEIMSSGILIRASLKQFAPTNGGKIVEFKEVQP